MAKLKSTELDVTTKILKANVEVGTSTIPAIISEFDLLVEAQRNNRENYDNTDICNLAAKELELITVTI